MLAPLQRKVHKLGVLLHCEAAYDVGVLIRNNERADLLASQLIELQCAKSSNSAAAFADKPQYQGD